MGLIPARAGRTRPDGTWLAVGTAHPRSRGADPQRDRRITAAAGLIPARAGRTPPWTSPTCMGTAHPRSRGADPVGFRPAAIHVGSSPLARGGLDLLLSDPSAGRLIPARAGRTARRGCRRGWWWAHPRSRGADAARTTKPSTPTGSSPLARGGLAVRLQCGGGARLIPARAGRTGQDRGRHRSSPAHPRSRGADVSRRGRARPRPGSSPLARGGLAHYQSHGLAFRLIPARAGRTHDRPPPGWDVPAHPRSRGADQRGRPRLVWRGGSSPLARGGRLGRHRHPRPGRLIPARAGRTF